MYVPYVLTKLGKLKLLTAYTVAYMRFLIYNVASRATRFAVVYLHKNFISAQPHNYICKNESLASRFQAKYFHIYTSVSKLPESKYVLYIHINMHI